MAVQENARPGEIASFFVDKVENLPPRRCCRCNIFRCCCEQDETRGTITVRVKEIEPTNQEVEPGNWAKLPLTFEFQGSSTKPYNTAVFTAPRQPRRFMEVHSGGGWRLRFDVFDAEHSVIGFAEIDAEELVKDNKTSWRLLLSSPRASDYESPIYGKQGDNPRAPTFLKVSRKIHGDPDVPGPDLDYIAGCGERPRHEGRKRVMIMTRGTRGDIQPYIALARGLVQHENCEVTIVTELCWKKFVQENREDLPPGTIHFRPSGGNTTKQTGSATAIAALRLGQHLDTLQTIMLSKSEQNFFSSEGCCFFWAKEEQPDFIVFGFTVTHMAMIISEKLSIPLVGFFLQPDRQIKPRKVQKGEIVGALLGPVREKIAGVKANAIIAQVMQQIPDGAPALNELRTSRGLNPYPRHFQTEFLHYGELKAKKVPMLVPISPVACTREDEREWVTENGFELTDFIFLRKPQDKLPSRIKDFIDRNKAKKRKIVAIAFSSMPVGENQILGIAAQFCDGSVTSADGQQAFTDQVRDKGKEVHRPAVIAFLKGQGFDGAKVQHSHKGYCKRLDDHGHCIVPSHNDDGYCLRCHADRLNGDDILLEWQEGAPFHELFPLVDAVVTQGGLGTTSEAFVAGIPVIISGVLLMDQRAWADRVGEKGCGPKEGGIYASDLHRRAPQVICNALSESSMPKSWKENAKDLQKELVKRRCETHGADLGEDGVALNAKCVYDAGMRRRGFSDDQRAYEDPSGFCGYLLRCCRQCVCCIYCLHRCIRCCICSQVPACVVCFINMALCLGERLAAYVVAAIAGFLVSQAIVVLIPGVIALCTEKRAAMETLEITNCTCMAISLATTALLWRTWETWHKWVLLIFEVLAIATYVILHQTLNRFGALLFGLCFGAVIAWAVTAFAVSIWIRRAYRATYSLRTDGGDSEQGREPWLRSQTPSELGV
eukprot:TRINITY_DN30376_c0_g1_i1.p1 TRINITY_DN30376_c0_g1~~TRINITY_DN30376_c0_g1_i1.p1  ORF type:complete len:958 (-),score=122.45 TRINITY_DN30376_c0_g1_i1:47-2872(-)